MQSRERCADLCSDSDGRRQRIASAASSRILFGLSAEQTSTSAMRPSDIGRPSGRLREKHTLLLARYSPRSSGASMREQTGSAPSERPLSIRLLAQIQKGLRSLRLPGGLDQRSESR